MEISNKKDTIGFEAFGVKIGIICNDPDLSEKIREMLPVIVPENLSFSEQIEHEHIFTLKRTRNFAEIFVARNDEEETKYTSVESLLDYLASRIRITVAEFAKSRVFIHAGAVSWNNYGIIIPGKSYSGKTTLVSELIKLGAEYYSDEYAVLDEDGFLRPYPKMLSMRGIINDWDQVDTEPEKFGATIGKKKIPVGMVLLTKYSEKGKWRPKIMMSGEGILEVLQHTIPIRNNPDFVLNVLKKAFSRAIIAKSKRGAAQEFAPFFLEYLQTALNK